MTSDAWTSPPVMNAERAKLFVKKMVARESHGPGDTEAATARLEQRYGIGFWQLSHLRKGNAKTVETSLYARIRDAYLDMCQKQVGSLLHEIAMEAAGGDDNLEDLEAEAQALARKIKAKKAGLKLMNGGRS